MARLMAVGTISKRADGAVWKKTTPSKWVQEKDGAPSSGSGGQAEPVMAPGAHGPDEPAEHPWARTRARYGLDGHLPGEGVGRDDVTVDVEGDIDSKPVLSWSDGHRTRRSYTESFHFRRHAQLHGGLQQHRSTLELAIEKAREGVRAGRRGHAGALLHLISGHLPQHIEQARTHVHRGDATEAAAEKKSEKNEPLAKSHSSDPLHPDRVHVNFVHPHGNLAAFSVHDPDLAAHAEASGFEGAKPFGSVDDIASSLKELGVEDAGEDVVRHHALCRMAADLLSKREPVDPHLEVEQRLDFVYQTLLEVSDALGEHLGHEEPCPEGMMFVPPSIAIAYTAEAAPELFDLDSMSSDDGDGTEPAVTVDAPTSQEVVEARDALADTDEAEDLAKSVAMSDARAIVAREHGTADGHDKLVDAIYRSLRRKNARAQARKNKGKPSCSPTEDARSSSSPADSSSSDLLQKSVYTPTTEELPSKTPGPSPTDSGPKSELLQPSPSSERPYTVRLIDADGAPCEPDHDTLLHYLRAIPEGLKPGASFKVADGYAHVVSRDGADLVLRHDSGHEGVASVDEAVEQIERLLKSVLHHVVTSSTHPVEVLPPRAFRNPYPFQGYVDFQGLKIDLENVAGSVREGVDPNGQPWRVLMHAHYGEIRNTTGTDEDKLDCYVGPFADSPVVVVVDQKDPDTDVFDENKVMLGFASVEEALHVYNRQYNRLGFYGGHESMSIGEFRRWCVERGRLGIRVARDDTLTKNAQRDLHQLLQRTFTDIGDPDEALIEKARLLWVKLQQAVERGRVEQSVLDRATIALIGRDWPAFIATCKLTKSAAPVGYISTYADGSQHQKVAPGDWREIGAGPADQRGKKEDGAPARKTSVKRLTRELLEIKARLHAASDPQVKAQIALELKAARRLLERALHRSGHSQESAMRKNVYEACLELEKLNKSARPAYIDELDRWADEVVQGHGLERWLKVHGRECETLAEVYETLAKSAPFNVKQEVRSLAARGAEVLARRVVEIYGGRCGN